MTATQPRGNGRTRAERPMVPKAEFTSYYGLPVLNQPVWKVDIPVYFFLGGLAGASSVLAAGADRRGGPQLARRTKVTAVVAIGAGAVALVHDLGQPRRFYNMLRVVKVSSPMSVGSWLLSAYAPAAGVAALSAVTGRAPRFGATATASAAVLGPIVSTYTAALVSDTAVPAWHEWYRGLPFVFAGSSAAAAGGVALVTAPVAETAAARRFAIAGAALELTMFERMKQQLGMVGEVYDEGKAGQYLKAAKALTISAIVAAVIGRRRRFVSMVSGAMFAVASLCTRLGIMEAGKASAADPKYTVAPQRARAAARGVS